MTYICASEKATIGSNIGLSPGQLHPKTLLTDSLGINFTEFLI